MIPGYTHLRRAQAVLWPHYLLAYFEMFSRDFERWNRLAARRTCCHLGSGALAGSGFRLTARRSRRTCTSLPSRATAWMFRPIATLRWIFYMRAVFIMLHLSRLSEDWILYSSEEFEWMTLGDGVTSGSSLMPQKKNPDSLELIRGKSGRVFGDLTSLFVTMKGLPMTYNRDMQEDKEPIFDAFHQTSGSLAMAKVVAESVVSNRRNRRRRRTKAGWWRRISRKSWRAAAWRFTERIR